MNIVSLNNGETDSNVYYPRLQIGKTGEIILATHKEGVLTTGILVGLLPGCKSLFKFGKKFVDWEVLVGELTDYNCAIVVNISNKVSNKV